MARLMGTPSSNAPMRCAATASTEQTLYHPAPATPAVPNAHNSARPTGNLTSLAWIRMRPPN